MLYRASSVYLWLLVQSAMNMEVSVWIYGYYIMEILNILIDGLTPCCLCVGLVCTESGVGIGLCDMLLCWPRIIVGWVSPSLSIFHISTI